MSALPIHTRLRELSDALGGEPQVGPAGEYLLVERRYGLEYRHGAARVSDLVGWNDFCGSHFNCRAHTQAIPRESLLFLDTETTGLAGGTGTVAFLIGAATLGDDCVTVRQYLLPDYGDEAALLGALLGEFSGDTHLVTYNGRSFDMPIALNRMIINRVARDIPFAEHIDALFPTRALLRRRIESCSLKNVEARLFGYERIGDIPGHLIPGVYFSWLANGRTDELSVVLEHNRLDILSLALLTGWISRQAFAGGAELSHASDVFSYLHWRARGRDFSAVAALYEQNGQRLREWAEREDLARLGYFLRRAGRVDDASAIWRDLAEGADPIAFGAHDELARYTERSLRDYDAALAHTVCALAIGPRRDADRDRLNRRRKRLMVKLKHSVESD